MAVVVGTDSYGNEAGLTAYAAKRGVALTGDYGDESVILILAMDAIEYRKFHGLKYEEFQSLEFPRNIVLYGDVEGEVPVKVINAQYEAAILIDQGEDLTPVVERAVKRERVEGAIDVTYQDNASDTTSYPQIERMLAPYLAGSGLSFEVVS